MFRQLEQDGSLAVSIEESRDLHNLGCLDILAGSEFNKTIRVEHWEIPQDSIPSHRIRLTAAGLAALNEHIGRAKK